MQESLICKFGQSSAHCFELDNESATCMKTNKYCYFFITSTKVSTMLHASKANELTKEARVKELNTRIDNSIMDGNMAIGIRNLNEKLEQKLKQHGYKVMKQALGGFLISWEEA